MGRLAPRESAPAGDPPRPAARRAAPATQVGIGLDRANSESEAAEAAIPIAPTRSRRPPSQLRSQGVRQGA